MNWRLFSSRLDSWCRTNPNSCWSNLPPNAFKVDSGNFQTYAALHTYIAIRWWWCATPLTTKGSLTLGSYLYDISWKTVYRVNNASETSILHRTALWRTGVHALRQSPPSPLLSSLPLSWVMMATTRGAWDIVEIVRSPNPKPSRICVAEYKYITHAACLQRTSSRRLVLKSTSCHPVLDLDISYRICYTRLCLPFPTLMNFWDLVHRYPS